MKLYILRHGSGEGRDASVSDSKGGLPNKHHAELRVVLRGLKRLKVRPDVVLSSSRGRTSRTVIPAVAALLKNAKVVKCDALEPFGTAPALWTVLKEYASLNAIMIVGHRLLVNDFAAYVLDSPQLKIKLKKLGCLRIDVDSVGGDSHSAKLRWLLTRTQLSAIGAADRREESKSQAGIHLTSPPRPRIAGIGAN